MAERTILHIDPGAAREVSHREARRVALRRFAIDARVQCHLRELLLEHDRRVGRGHRHLTASCVITDSNGNCDQRKDDAQYESSHLDTPFSPRDFSSRLKIDNTSLGARHCVYTAHSHGRILMYQADLLKGRTILITGGG